MKIALAAGGTGGHIYPGIAIAEELKKRDPNNEILFIGSRDGLEKDLIIKEGFNIELISARGILRKISYKALSAPFVTACGFFQSLGVLSKFRPDFVVVMGGYVGFPVALAAKILGIKTMLHEQNVLPGFVNRILSRFVNITVLSFHESLKYLNGTVVGNPVRERIKAQDKVLRLRSGQDKILIVGGSQGARSINNAIVNDLKDFINKNIELVHIIGDRDYKNEAQKYGELSKTYSFYHPAAYMYNIEEALKDCSLVVSRAGATAISEFLVMGIPSILIPFPYSAEDHQKLNAKVIADSNAAVYLDQNNILMLSRLIIDLIADKKRIEEMSRNALLIAKPKAAAKIADLIYEKV